MNDNIKELKDKLLKKAETVKDEREKKRVNNLIEKLDAAASNVKEAMDDVKNDISDEEKRKKAENKLDALEEVCDEILKVQGCEPKKGGKKVRKVKEDLNKIDGGLLNEDQEMTLEGKRQLKANLEALKKELDKESKDEDNKLKAETCEKLNELDALIFPRCPIAAQSMLLFIIVVYVHCVLSECRTHMLPTQTISQIVKY